MTHPIKVNYDALSHDATTWDDVGDQLSGAAQAGNGQLCLPESAFSLFYSKVSPAYEEVRTLLTSLCTSGASATHAAATALRKARADYEAAEGHASAEISELWQPLGVE